MKKYVIGLLLCMVIVCLYAFAGAEVIGGETFYYSNFNLVPGGNKDLNWSLNLATGEMTISGTGGWNDYSTAGDVIYSPWSTDYLAHDNYGDYRSSIKKVVIKEGITSVAGWAFKGCTNLTSVSLPSTITRISTSAFSGCTSLISIELPAKLESIGAEAFCDCSSLTKADIPQSVTSIGDGAFRRTTALRGAIVTYGVVGESAFRGCGASSIEVKNCTVIMPYAFQACDNLTQITISNDITTIPEHAFAYNPLLTKINIPDGVTSIGKYAYGECSALRSIDLPDSLTTIEEQAFYKSGLSSIVLPDSVAVMGDNVFGDCKNLMSSNVPKALGTIPKSMFKGCISLINVDIEDGITHIGNDAFYNCSSLAKVTLPDSIMVVGNSAFRYCNELTSINLPESAQIINDSAFDGCSNLVGITIPDGVVKIGERTFCDSGLTWIGLPASLSSIKDSAFGYCSQLKNVYYAGNDQKNISIADYNNSSLINAVWHYNESPYTGQLSELWKISYDWSKDYSQVKASAVCSNNANHVITETVNTNSEVTKEATCEEEGSTTYTSEKFQNAIFEVQTKVVAEQPLGHIWEETEYSWADDYTWVTASRYCNRDWWDQHYESETVDAHIVSAVEPTCEEYGYNTVESDPFTNPDFKVQSITIDIAPKGHSLIKHNKIEATALKNGVEAYWECSECGKLFSDEDGVYEITEPVIIPAKGKHVHTLIKHAKVEATCTSDGCKAYWECSECGKYFSDSNAKNEIEAPEIIKAKGHSLKKHDKVDATDTTEGTEAYWECTRCHKLFSDEKGTKEIKEPVVIPMKDKVAQFVNRSYNVILDRKPDAGGMNTWLNELNSGRKTASEIIDRFVNSPEFIGKNYSNEEAVDILYQTMLGRNADPAGKANWVNKLKSGQTLANVINGFCFSKEFRGLCDSYGIKAGFVNIENTDTTAEGKIKAFVQRCYRIILDREADPSGMQTWYEQLSSGKKAAAEIIDRFVNSPEFSGKRYSHSDSVEILYKAMLGRGSDAAGKANWVGKLNAGQPFAVVINGFCVSKEFTGICASYGIKPGNVNIQLSAQSEEELSMLALNAKAPITRRSETKPNRVEIINPSDTIDMNIGTAVQAVYINEEKAKEFISQCYRVILGREASEAELENWIGQMVNGTKTPDQIARGFMFSNEFKAKNTANEDLVKILYRVYMNRDADPEGLKTWTEKLDNGISLKDLLDAFAKTSEFKKVISEMSK